MENINKIVTTHNTYTTSVSHNIDKVTINSDIFDISNKKDIREKFVTELGNYACYTFADVDIELFDKFRNFITNL